MKLPEYLQDPSPTTINMVTDGDASLVNDIRDSLRYVGLLSPEGVEVQTDEIIRRLQGQEGLIGSITHQSDGVEPTTICAVMDNDLRGERRLPPSQWD